MNIAIISDTHDNLAAVQWIIEYLNRQEIITAFHAGDIIVPGVVKMFADHYKGHLHYIFGNNDGEQAKHMEIVQKNPDKLTLYLWAGMSQEFAGKKIFMNHYSEIAELVAKSGEYDLCIGGHDHQYRVIKHGNSLFVNPGNTLVKNSQQEEETSDFQHSFVVLDLQNMTHERVMIPRNTN
jgi:hypothetical protein